ATLIESMVVDTIVTDAAGQSYGAVIDDVTGCPAFLGGMITLTAGATAKGCVSFEVPVTSPVTTVRFGLGGPAATGFVRWRAG
ncbi:MAG: hypothetical protein ACRD0H_15385, partial [Actinomycetes bacterium]